jgi:hypothetical protein
LRLHNSLRLIALGATSLALACSDNITPIGPPKAIRPVTATTFTADAGSTIPGGVTVHVVDYADRSVSGIKVAFSIIAGDGSVTPRLDITDADGQAHAEWILGQTAGANEVLVSIQGTDSTASFSATGTPGPAVAMSITPHTLRMPVGTNSATVIGQVVDQYGNVITSGATYESRNPDVVTVNSTTGAVAVAPTRGGTTYIVATGSSFKDSSYVVVLKTGDTPCTGITAMANLSVGQVMTTGFVDNGICVPAAAGGREYAIVPYYESAVPSAQTVVSVRAFGITAAGPLGAANPVAARSVMAPVRAPAPIAFHERLRRSELREIPSRTAAARQWYAGRTATESGRRALRTAVVPAVGDQMQLNVNANDFCTNAMMRTGRVVAVTNRAVVVADVANPVGFTDAEYQAIGVNFDTLVYALDVANFGAPTDIDNNGGRIVLFFTHAVNEMGGGVLGYFYGRDLFPKSGPLGTCPGSNVAEIMYLLVPDPAGPNKTFVASNAVGTSAHEFQHLINGSRRLYVNTNAAPVEERWLNEGLSHIAEELLFYRASALTPRSNIGLQIFSPSIQPKYVDYQVNNSNRYREYVKAPDIESPVGVTEEDDDLATRGAIWSFLRYAADRRAPSNETAFWNSLANSNSTGMTNLYEIVGADTRTIMRDWALSVFLDDLVTTDPKYQQPSWNHRAVGGYTPDSRTLINNSLANFIIRAGGNVFARFGLAAGQEAFVSASGANNAPLPKYVLLALVRTK